MSGVDLRRVSELLGHRSISMTMKYAHLSPAHKVAAIERLEKRNRQEKTAPAAAILTTLAVERIGTRTDTEPKQAVPTVTPNVQ